VTGWAKTDEARVEWLPACFMHSAKVINLPSHSTTIQSNWMYKKKRKKNDLPVLWRRCGWWQRGGPPPLIAFTPAFLCFYAHCPLYFLCFSLLSQSLWWWTEDGAGFSFQFEIWVLCWFFYTGTSAEMKAIAGTILYVCWISFLSFSPCIISLLWGFFFLLCFLCFWVNFSGPFSPEKSPGSGFSSPFYRETCPSTSPAFAGLLFKSRAGSWARDVVHDLLQISCWIGFIRSNVGDDEQCFQNGAVVSLGMVFF